MDIRQTAYLTRTSTLTVFFSKNNYNEDFNQRNTHRPTTIADNGVGNPSTRLFLTISPKQTHRQSYECKADNGIGIPVTRIFVVVVESESLRKRYINGVC